MTNKDTARPATDDEYDDDLFIIQSLKFFSGSDRENCYGGRRRSLKTTTTTTGEQQEISRDLRSPVLFSSRCDAAG